MTDEFERVVNFFIHFFDNMAKLYKCTWFLDKQTLVDFVCNRRITRKIYIGIINCNPKDLYDRAMAFNTPTRAGDGDLIYGAAAKPAPQWLAVRPN